MYLNKNALEIINEPNEWNALLHEIGVFDFYHTYDYHFIEKLDNEVPILIKYTEKDCIIALPLLIRKISNTNYYDATSVYGYVGPISKGISSGFNNEQFTQKLLNYFQEKNIVSVFSRLNPYIHFQKEILKSTGEIVTLGKVVNIDLKLDPTIQRQNYQNRLKTQINQSRRNCVIKKAITTDDLNVFIDIYHENMNRVKAKKYYFFSKEYFNKIFNSGHFKTEILLAQDRKSGIIIAGCIFISTNNIVQYHLSGTKTEFLHLSPTKILIDEMRIIATKRGMTFFNLGGGVGGDCNNSLFHFKSLFSKDFKDFNLWELIVNQKTYDELVEKRKAINTSFFPKYRY